MNGINLQASIIIIEYAFKYIAITVFDSSVFVNVLAILWIFSILIKETLSFMLQLYQMAVANKNNELAMLITLHCEAGNIQPQNYWI